MDTNTDAESKEAHVHPSMALSDSTKKPERHEKSVDQEAEQPPPKGWNLALIMLSVYASMFLVALVCSSSLRAGAF
jgi:hypothetical protein